MKASICIQRAVRQHLKKKRVTMSRTRCVQFFWKKFCRLLKLSSSVKASRLIKQIMQKRVNKILKQYRSYKFRICINERITLKKVLIVQKLLRKVLTRKKQAHYEQNMHKIIFIQSFFRMLKPRRKFKQLMRNKMMREMQARNFEKGYMMLYNQKPNKRKSKINKILQEQQEVLKRERIFIGQQGITHNGVIGKSASKLISVIGQQQMPKDRREKTIKALRYIKKYQHLYQDEILASGTQMDRQKQKSPDKRFPLAKQKLGTQQTQKFLNMDSSLDRIISNRHLAQIEQHQNIVSKIKGVSSTGTQQFKLKPKTNNLDSQLSKIVDEKLYSQIAQNKSRGTLRERTPISMRKGSVVNGTSTGQSKTRNNEIPVNTRMIEKPKLSKNSPYLKDQSVWQARQQDVPSQYLLNAQAAASTIYPKGSQIGNKLTRLRALSPLGSKKITKSKNQLSDMTYTHYTDETYGMQDKVLAHVKAEKLALQQSTRGSTGISSHAKLGKSKKKDERPTLFESAPFYEDSHTITSETPQHAENQLPYLISNQNFNEGSEFFKKSVFDSHDHSHLTYKHQILNSQARVGRQRMLHLDQKLQAGFHQRLKPISKGNGNGKQRQNCDLSDLQDLSAMNSTVNETHFGMGTKPGTSPKVSQGQSNFLMQMKPEVDHHSSYMQVYLPSEKTKKVRRKSDISKSPNRNMLSTRREWQIQHLTKLTIARKSSMGVYK